MDSQPLYDLSPVLRLMLMGVVLALAPLAWAWLRNRQAAPAQRLAALTLLTLFLTFDLVLVGAFTRLTDSGLGCPDWPGCYGSASPTGAHAQISAEQARMPTGPVTHAKAWIEMLHRYFAMGLGVLTLVLAGATWLEHRRGRLPVNPWLPTASAAWTCVIGAFGALTVTMRLFPAIVTMHLLAAMVLLALLCTQAVAYAQFLRGSQAHGIPAAPRRVLLAAFALLWIQIALGGWVSTNYAVLACDEFPTCQGAWWPQMEFREGFELWRELGKTGEGSHVSFAALTAIHYAHRLAAYGVLAVLAACAWLLRGGPLARQSRWIAGLALWQLATGLSNVVLGWPLVAALAHTGGAAALVVVLTWALRESRAEPAPDASRVHPLREAPR
jgi:heme a synthase